MEHRPQRERRRSNAKYYGPERRKKFSPLVRQLKGWCDMCRKSSICPEFERRTKEGITSACAKWRIALFITFIVFRGSTYIMYN